MEPTHSATINYPKITRKVTKIWHTSITYLRTCSCKVRICNPSFGMCTENELGSALCVEVSWPLWFRLQSSGPHRPCHVCYGPHIFVSAFYIRNEISLDIQYGTIIKYYKLYRHDTYNDHKDMI